MDPSSRELLSRLGYLDCGSFLTPADFERPSEFSHIFRRAVSTFDLVGVLALGPEHGGVSTPVVYVAQGATVAEADRIHRQVWNQNVAPFVIVQTPADGLILYAGFRCSPDREDNVLTVVDHLDDALDQLDALRLPAVLDGTVWRAHPDALSSKGRVDWKLLGNLRDLAKELTAQDLDKRVAHALIGKFVFLRYLRDRAILTDARFEAWGLQPDAVFSRHCTREAIEELLIHLDAWLNGSVFPLDLASPGAPDNSQIQLVASVFAGDDVDGQLHLDFKAYDFSFIPIETLSIIYEQFLDIEGRQRSMGAYYTPLPLVNFLLEEVDEYRSVAAPCRILDPSCGSGAFLVQCFRRLVERERSRVGQDALTPFHLSALLTSTIFGVDRDQDACRVTELSLVLTLLDYVTPPDLMAHPTFRLPSLSERNVFEADFFDADSGFANAAEEKFDIVVGNPPWFRLGEGADDAAANAWAAANASKCPVTERQVAEAFAWKALDHLGPDGVAGLIVPSMSLYKAPASFRAAFFSTAHMHSVGDFSNLREVLFGGRGRQPAASLVYGLRNESVSNEESIVMFAPSVINQESNRPAPGHRMDTWSLVVNASEVSLVDRTEAAKGAAVTWKLGAYGSRRDAILMTRLHDSVPTLGEFLELRGLHASEGPQLRASMDAREQLDSAPEFKGQRRVVTNNLGSFGRLFAFPEVALEVVPADLDSVRRGRKRTPLQACRPPHVLVNAGRAWAIFSDEFLIPAARQLGISGAPEQRDNLILLTLFLNSDFLAYWEFLTTGQAGIYGALATLKSLRATPCPLGSLEPTERQEWLRLHERLVDNSRARIHHEQSGSLSNAVRQSAESLETEQRVLLEELNRRVSQLLGLTTQERWLVEDLVHVRKHVIEGKVSREAVDPPTEADLEGYANALEGELDSFLRSRAKHDVSCMCGKRAGIVSIRLHGQTLDNLEPFRLDQVFDRLHAHHNPAWLYFDRNLLLFDDHAAHFLKPAQRIWWTRSQALQDADRLIADSLGGQ